MVAVMPLGPHARLVVDDYGRRTDKVYVKGAPGAYITIRLFTMFVAEGDTLLITGELNLTNNTGRDADQDMIPGYEAFGAGIATSLWIYDANAPAAERPATWLRLGTNGENCTVEGHHIAQGLQRPYQVPAGWDPTHQMGIVLRVDAHSTAYKANPVPGYFIVEKHGTLHVEHWPAATPEVP